MPILILALKSIRNRRVSAFLTILSISLSVMLLLGVERLRNSARTGFENTISGTDLVVGARSGSIPLLLYSVFRIGDATNNISWRSYQVFANDGKVAWSIPLSLGDSHRGFRVMGTNSDYFKYFRFGHSRILQFDQGNQFHDLYEAVLGTDVAEELGYSLNQEIVISHGMSKAAIQKHEDKPFKVVGILEKTGTPVDRTIHVSLEGIEAIHIDWQEGSAPQSEKEISAEEARKMELQPKVISAFFLGLHSKMSIFRVQREINEYRREPLLAILPGATLQQLWQLIGIVEKTLLVISAFVVLSGLIGMLTAILSSLNERRREMAIIRSVGGRPIHIFALITTEALILSVAGVIGGLLLLNVALSLTQSWIETQFGIYIPVQLFTDYDLKIMFLIIVTALFLGTFPAWRAYRNALADGLTIKL